MPRAGFTVGSLAEVERSLLPPLPAVRAPPPPRSAVAASPTLRGSIFPFPTSPASFTARRTSYSITGNLSLFSRCPYPYLSFVLLSNVPRPLDVAGPMAPPRLPAGAAARAAPSFLFLFPRVARTELNFLSSASNDAGRYDFPRRPRPDASNDANSKVTGREQKNISGEFRFRTNGRRMSRARRKGNVLWRITRRSRRDINGSSLERDTANETFFHFHFIRNVERRFSARRRAQRRWCNDLSAAGKGHHRRSRGFFDDRSWKLRRWPSRIITRPARRPSSRFHTRSHDDSHGV